MKQLTQFPQILSIVTREGWSHGRVAKVLGYVNKYNSFPVLEMGQYTGSKIMCQYPWDDKWLLIRGPLPFQHKMKYVIMYPIQDTEKYRLYCLCVDHDEASSRLLDAYKDGFAEADIYLLEPNRDILFE